MKMKLKMRKVKSWLRWGKKQYEERMGIKLKGIYIAKNQLLAVQESQIIQRKIDKDKDVHIYSMIKRKFIQ